MALRGRRRNQGYLSPNLTPLLDVVLQLITFFMMLVHFGVKIEGATKAVRLPTAPAAMPGSEMALDRLVVAIDSRGQLIAGNDRLEGAAAEAWWDTEAKKRKEGQQALGAPAEELPTLVVIRADKDASYGSVRRALATAQARGFAHFTLVVLRRRTP